MLVKDYPLLKKVAENTYAQKLFFIKHKKELNAFLDTKKFPKNVHIIVSLWIMTTNTTCQNLKYYL